MTEHLGLTEEELIDLVSFKELQPGKSIRFRITETKQKSAESGYLMEEVICQPLKDPNVDEDDYEALRKATDGFKSRVYLVYPILNPYVEEPPTPGRWAFNSWARMLEAVLPEDMLPERPVFDKEQKVFTYKGFTIESQAAVVAAKVRWGSEIGALIKTQLSFDPHIEISEENPNILLDGLLWVTTKEEEGKDGIVRVTMGDPMRHLPDDKVPATYEEFFASMDPDQVALGEEELAELLGETGGAKTKPKAKSKSKKKKG